MSLIVELSPLPKGKSMSFSRLNRAHFLVLDSVYDHKAYTEKSLARMDWYGEAVCEMDGFVHLTGPETLDSADFPSFS